MSCVVRYKGGNHRCGIRDSIFLADREEWGNIGHNIKRKELEKDNVGACECDVSWERIYSDCDVIDDEPTYSVIRFVEKIQDATLEKMIFLWYRGNAGKPVKSKNRYSDDEFEDENMLICETCEHMANYAEGFLCDQCLSFSCTSCVCNMNLDMFCCKGCQMEYCDTCVVKQGDSIIANCLHCHANLEAL